MSFRAAVSWLTLLACVGCGLNTGEKAPPPVVLDTGKYSCLSQIGQKAEDYVNGRMSDDQVSTYFGCMQNSIQLFIDRFHGHDDWNSFTPQEIRSFIEENYLPDDHKVSDELLHQFMLIKQSLFGGPVDKVNRSDLQNAIQILDQLRTEAVRLRPFVKVLNPSLVDLEEPSTLHDKILGAEQAVGVSSHVIGSILARGPQPYAFQDFQTFLVEFRKFARWNEHFDGDLSPAQWVHLASAFKSTTVSPGDQAIKSTDWISFLDSSTRWYLGYIKFKVGIRNQPIMEGQGFSNFIAWGHDIRDLLSRAVDNQPTQFVDFSSTRNLISAIKDMNWLPKTLRVDSAEQALEAMVTKVLGPDVPNAAHRTTMGITDLTIANLWVEFSQWQEIQIGLQANYNEMQRRLSIQQHFGTKIPALDYPLNISDEPTHRTGWDGFLSAFRDGRPLFKADYDRVFLIEAPKLKTYDVTNGFFNLSKINTYRTVLDVIFKGYAEGDKGSNWRTKGVPEDAGISQTRIESFYCDFRNLGVDLGYLDSRTPNAAGRTFMEAKMFTYLADGMSTDATPVLNLTQGIQEGAFLYSGGETAQDMYNHMYNYCKRGELDLRGNAKLDRGCVRTHLLSELNLLIHTMPAYAGTKEHPGFVNRLTPAEKAEYADILLATALNQYSRRDLVELSELQTISMVVHYAEAIFTRFNTNMDDVLTESEINQALPIFTGLIYKMATQLGYSIPSDGFAAHAFKFILAYGHVPSGVGDEAEIARHWVTDMSGTGESWDLSLNRMQIAKVFQAIVEKITAASTGPGAKSPCH